MLSFVIHAWYEGGNIEEKIHNTLAGYSKISCNDRWTRFFFTEESIKCHQADLTDLIYIWQEKF